MSNSYYVYILTNKKNGTLYTGVTNDLLRRVYEHKHKITKGFSSTYHIDKLVYFEQFDDVYEAICREKQIKKWNRAWKIRLIENFNPKWNDLFFEFGGKEYQAGIDYSELKEQRLDSRLRGNDKPSTIGKSD